MLETYVYDLKQNENEMVTNLVNKLFATGLYTTSVLKELIDKHCTTGVYTVLLLESFVKTHIYTLCIITGKQTRTVNLCTW